MTDGTQRDAHGFPRVADRDVVSKPDRVIRVARVTVSRAQKTAVAEAIRTGREAARKSR